MKDRNTIVLRTTVNNTADTSFILVVGFWGMQYLCFGPKSVWRGRNIYRDVNKPFCLHSWLPRWRPIRKWQNGQSQTVALEIANYACLSVRTKEVILPSDCTSTEIHKNGTFACCLPTLIFQECEILIASALATEDVSLLHQNNRHLRGKNRDFVFIRELLSHHLSSQGQHTHIHTKRCCSLAILFKRFVPYSSPLNEAVNLETWEPLQCSSESFYNDPGTELVN